MLGTPHWYAFGAGFLAGYLLYDMTHYYLHHHKPRTRVGRWLRELHMRHHFQDDTSGLRDQRAVLGQGVRDLLAAAQPARRARNANVLS